MSNPTVRNFSSYFSEFVSATVAMVFALGIAGGLGLVVLKGLRWGWHAATAEDDTCFWMSKQTPAGACLFDVAAGSDGCFPSHESPAVCGDVETIAAFTQKAGRRICGHVGRFCSEAGH